MVVKNTKAVASMVIEVSTLILNDFVAEVIAKNEGRDVVPIHRLADMRKDYANEGDFRNDAMAALAALNVLFNQEGRYVFGLQNLGRGRGKGWHVVLINKAVASKAAASSEETEDDAKAVQEAVAQAAQAVAQASATKAAGRRKAAKAAQQAAQASQESQAVATQAVATQAVQASQASGQASVGNVIAIFKRPDKDRSCLVVCDKTHKDTVKACAEAAGLWLRWNWRFKAWNAGRRGLAAFVDGLKAAGLRVRADATVQAWIEEDRQQAATVQASPEMQAVQALLAALREV